LTGSFEKPKETIEEYLNLEVCSLLLMWFQLLQRETNYFLGGTRHLKDIHFMV